MNFINLWNRPITLGLGTTQCPLDLPDGVYRLAIAEGLNKPAGRFEIVQALLEGGQATLTRGLEDTADADWPAGSVIYATVTAWQMQYLFEQIETLQQRVAALEGAGPETPDGALTDTDGNVLVDQDDNILITQQEA